MIASQLILIGRLFRAFDPIFPVGFRRFGFATGLARPVDSFETAALPLSPPVWVGVAAAVAALAAVLVLSRGAGGGGGGSGGSKRKKCSLFDSVVTSFVTLLSQPFPRSHGRRSLLPRHLQLLLLTCAACQTLLVLAYQSNLRASLVYVRRERPMKETIFLRLLRLQYPTLIRVLDLAPKYIFTW